jgi:hypothetical protein
MYEKNLEHKFLIDVDGNGWSSRFASLLKTGAVVFKSTKVGVRSKSSD